jgi:hypothetical protein
MSNQPLKTRVVRAQAQTALLLGELVALEHFMPEELKRVIMGEGIHDLLGGAATGEQVSAIMDRLPGWRESYEEVMKMGGRGNPAGHIRALAGEIESALSGESPTLSIGPGFSRELQSADVFEEAGRIAASAGESVRGGTPLAGMTRNMLSSVSASGEMGLFGMVQKGSMLVPGLGMAGGGNLAAALSKDMAGVMREAAGIAVDLAGAARVAEGKIVAALGPGKTTAALAPVLAREPGPLSTRDFSEAGGTSFNSAAAFLERAGRAGLVTRDAAPAPGLAQKFFSTEGRKLRMRRVSEPEARHLFTDVMAMFASRATDAPVRGIAPARYLAPHR